MNQQILITIIKLMFLVLVGGFVYILIKGAAQPDMHSRLVGSVELAAQPEFANIAPGETTLRRVNGAPTWVTRVDASLLAQMDEVPTQPNTTACALQTGLCFLNARTSVSGILFTYTDTAPPQLASSIPWFGGYVDPNNGNVFDRLGRAYALNESVPAAMQALQF